MWHNKKGKKILTFNIKSKGGVKMKNVKDDKFIVSVKVGPKGQITVPAEARKMFNIKEGDTLMVMGDINKGIALIKDEMFYALMGGMFNDENSNKDK